MEDGSVDYKTVSAILDGAAESLEEAARIAQLRRKLKFTIKPPTEGSFEIIFQAHEWVGATLSMLQQPGTIKDVANILLEYLKIKKAMKGEVLNPANIKHNEQGSVTITNGSGQVVYIDSRKIINQNFILGAANSAKLNKGIGQIATAVARDSNVDDILLQLSDDVKVNLQKEQSSFWQYTEQFSERLDGFTGYVRKIDNKTFKGVLIVPTETGDLNVNFELDIADIKRLEPIVRALAIAEGQSARVRLLGKKQFDSEQKIKKIIVHDMELVDKPIDFLA